MNTESRNMVKVRLNSKTSAVERRKSRGKEQKKNREKTVNKSRGLMLLSDDMQSMSPVVETDEVSPSRIEKRREKDPKPETRLERLKRWREQKQKQKDEQKKTKQSVFRAGKLDHKETKLYAVAKKENSKAKDPEQTKGTNKKAPLLPKTFAPSKAPVFVKKPQVKEEKIKSTVSTEKKVTRASKSIPIEVKNMVKQISSPSRKLKIARKPEIIDMSSKLTAAAKAKMTENKQTGFLRSKRTETQLQKKKEKPKPKGLAKGQSSKQEGHTDGSDPHLSDSTVPSPKHSTPAVHNKSRKSLSRLASQVQITSDSSDEQGTNVEAVKNAQTSRRKSRRVSRINVDLDKEAVEAHGIGSSTRKSVMHVEVYKIEEQDLVPVDDKAVLEDQSNENVQVDEKEILCLEFPNAVNDLDSSTSILEKSNKENVSQSRQEVRSATSVVRQRRSRHSLSKRSLHSIARESAFSAGKVQRRKSSKIQSQRKSIPNSKFDVNENSADLAAESVNEQVSGQSIMDIDVDEAFPQKDENKADTQAPDVCDTKTTLPEQTAETESIFRKRKSLRTASSETESETEHFTALRKTPRRRSSLGRGRKTPRRSSRRHRRNSSITPRKGSHSTIVSISDEGTTNMKGSNVIENVLILNQVSTPTGKAEPKPDHVRSGGVQRSSRQSLTLSVSGEGMSTEDSETFPSSTAAYHIGKSAFSEKPESRILQELEVEKVDGEISFIEVPMDESFGGSPVKRQSVNSSLLSTNADSTQSFSPRSSKDITANSSGQGENGSEAIALVKHEQNVQLANSPKVMVRDEEEEVRSSQNTGAQTPEVKKEGNEMTMTPRSLRSRARSLAPSAFKEPGEPLSALRTRSTRKRRKTEHSTPSKTPEQMIALLKKSPMIEMTRRRSRHISTPAATKSNFLAMMDELSVQELASKSSPAILDEANNSTVESDSGVPPTVQSDSSVLPTVKNVLPGVECAIKDSDCVESESFTAEEMQVDECVEQSHEDIQAAKVKPFRDTVNHETIRLNSLCDEWNLSITTPGLSDDVLGEIRSVIGKAQLLIKDRFKQFSGLIDNCQFSRGEKETTPTDLQGFWDMIYFQVEDVNKMFANLTELQQNGWQCKVTEPVKKTVVKTKSVNKTNKPKAKSNFAAFRAEMIKRKALAAATAKNEDVEKDTEHSEEAKTFDGGFFAVESPVRSPCKLSEVKQTATESESSMTPRNPLNKENESSTLAHQKRVSLSVKRLRYTPAKNSPLLNDITHFEGKMS